MPAGGTRPRREPAGKVTSAAAAARIARRSRSANHTARPISMPASGAVLRRQKRERGVMAECIIDLVVERCAAQGSSRSLRLRYTPHRDIDPSALGEQGGGPRVNAIHAMEREPRIAT